MKYPEFYVEWERTPDAPARVRRVEVNGEEWPVTYIAVEQDAKDYPVVTLRVRAGALTAQTWPSGGAE